MQPADGAEEAERLFGRDRELAHLLALLPGPRSNLGGLVVVAGDAGIGKSSLVDEMARRAETAGITVLRGRCWQAEVSPAYWLWTQVFRTALGEPGSRDLGELLLDGEPSSDRFELFDSAAERLRQLAADRPVLVVAEDLHEADAESLLLTRFLARQLSGEPVLVLATARTSDQPTSADHVGLVETIEQARVLELSGLPLDAVARLVPTGGPVAAIHAASDGNPLHIEHLLRSVPWSELATGTGDSLVELARRRLRPLTEPARLALVALAVCASPQTLPDLAELCDRPWEEVRAGLAEASAAGIVAADGADGADGSDGSDGSGEATGAYGFTHQVLADAVRSEVPPATAQLLHQRHADLVTDDPVDRARHLLMADGAGSDRAVLEAVLDGAEHSMAKLAYEEAIGLCERALLVVDRRPRALQPVRVRILLALARATWSVGRRSDADHAVTRAWDLAVAADDLDGQALAALGPELRFDLTIEAARETSRRCSAVLAARPPEPDRLRVELLATLAAAQMILDATAARAAATEAMEVASRVRDPLAESYARAALALTDVLPDGVDTRLRSARFILATARATDERQLVSVGYYLLLAALLERADLQVLDTELTPRGKTVDHFPELHQGRHAQWFRCLRAILDGNAELAERLANQGLASAVDDGDEHALQVWSAQVGIIRWMQGRVAEAEVVFLAARQEQPEEPVWAASLAWLWYRQGRTDAAESLLSSLTDLDAVPRNRNWLTTMTVLAEVSSLTGTRERAEDLRDRLLPYADHIVPIGLGVAFWGSVARTLGLLSERLGRIGEARAHLHRAIRLCQRVGAQAWLTEAQIELADFELRHGGDRAEVRSRLEQARATAAALGFVGLQARADGSLADLSERGANQIVPVHGAPSAGSGRARSEIRVLGGFEVTAHTGHKASWNSRKARDLLKLLVNQRGVATSREVFMEHLWPGQDPERVVPRFSVAVNTVRRALDPERLLPSQHHVVRDGASFRLDLDVLTVDVEVFLQLARRTDQESWRQAVERYTGDAFADEPYADWAMGLRHEAQTAFCETAIKLARREAELGDHLSASELLRRVVDVDPYHREALQHLIGALSALGSRGQANLVRRRLEVLDEEFGHVG